MASGHVNVIKLHTEQVPLWSMTLPFWKPHVAGSLVSGIDSREERKIHKCLLNLCCHSHHQLSHPSAKLLTNSHAVPEDFSQLLSEKGSITKAILAGKDFALATINKKCSQPVVCIINVSCPNCVGIKSFFHWGMGPPSCIPPDTYLSQDYSFSRFLNLSNDQD